MSYRLEFNVDRVLSKYSLLGIMERVQRQIENGSMGNVIRDAAGLEIGSYWIVDWSEVSSVLEYAHSIGYSALTDEDMTVNGDNIVVFTHDSSPVRDWLLNL